MDLTTCWTKAVAEQCIPIGCVSGVYCSETIGPCIVGRVDAAFLADTPPAALAELREAIAQPARSLRGSGR
jgi:hypothetical protein